MVKVVQKGYNPNVIVKPSETIKEVMEDRQLTKESLTSLSGLTILEIEDLLEDKKHIDIRVSKGLEKATGIRASFWVNLFKRYEARLESK